MLLRKPVSVCAPGMAQVFTCFRERAFCLGYQTQTSLSLNKQSFEEGERAGEPRSMDDSVGPSRR